VTDYLDRPRGSSDPTFTLEHLEVSFWSARFGALLFEHLELRRELRGLDVACGAGFPLYELASAHGVSCRFTGIDTWQEALQRAAPKRRTYGVPDVTLARADAGRLPFRDACFDLVVSNLGVNNFDQPAAVFAECARVSRPGARIALTTNPKGHMREFYEDFRGVIEARRRPEELRRLAQDEDHRLDRAGIADLLEGAGFAVGRVIEERFGMRALDGSALLRHPLTRIGFLPGWREVIEPADEHAVFAALEARLNQRAARADGLEVSVPMLYVEARRR
jgi:ubiquinone/menaquinone biosynthesis C-methylase UbiE